jgi:hypothetical protein
MALTTYCTPSIFRDSGMLRHTIETAMYIKIITRITPNSKVESLEEVAL